jgi:hypothetical protein
MVCLGDQTYTANGKTVGLPIAIIAAFTNIEWKIKTPGVQLPITKEVCVFANTKS